MKNIITSLLLFTMLLNGTEVHEFIRLPKLFSHYYEHKSGNDNLSVIDFLIMHYHPRGTDSGAAKDTELPFKSLDSFHFIPAFSTTPPTFSEVQTILPQLSERLLFYGQAFITFQATSLIWQPPKQG